MGSACATTSRRRSACRPKWSGTPRAWDRPLPGTWIPTSCRWACRGGSELATEETALGRARARLVVLLRHAAGEERFAARFHRELHGASHAHRIACLRDRGIHEHAVAAELHG